MLFYSRLRIALLGLGISCGMPFVQAMDYAEPEFVPAPPIEGAPLIDAPQLLDWPLDIPASGPDLSEPTSNRIFDLHARISNCEDVNVVLSTAGNYHMALRDLWYDYFLPQNADLLKNWFYTTSPPIAPEQIQANSVMFGNVRLECRPLVAVGPIGIMDRLQELQFTEGDPIPVIRNYGNVILVKKGNPRHIRSIWDLGRPDVRVVTSNPYTEEGSFGNYRDSIYNIARHDKSAPAGWDADRLFDAIFNNGPLDKRQDKKSLPNKNAHVKWLAGKRIHHREVPWSIAYGQADAGLLFYHLALYMVRTFPDKFDIVPLGGSVDFPEPVRGNRVATLYIVRINGNLNADQYQARERLIEAYQSADFDSILMYHGLRRPEPE